MNVKAVLVALAMCFTVSVALSIEPETRRAQEVSLRALPMDRLMEMFEELSARHAELVRTMQQTESQLVTQANHALIQTALVCMLPSYASTSEYRFIRWTHTSFIYALSTALGMQVIASLSVAANQSGSIVNMRTELVEIEHLLRAIDGECTQRIKASPSKAFRDLGFDEEQIAALRA